MKRRLLFLSHRLPFPPHSGAAIRTYNTLRELSRSYLIDALCFDRIDAALAEQSLEGRLAQLAPFASCEAFAIPQQQSKLRLLLDHTRSVLTGRPYTYYVHASAPFLDRLQDLLRTRTYDIIHIDSFDLLRLLGFLPLEIVACTHHNVESELLARRARRERGLGRRTYVAWQARLLRAAEREWVPRLALNLCTSVDDLATLTRLAPGLRGAVVPNGVDAEYFVRPAVSRDGGLVFVGGTTWYPNRDALEWFVAEILPALRAGGIHCQVSWVGRVSAGERTRYAGVPGLVLTGYVEDVRPYLARARCFVAPIRVGGGTRLKVLDAWAMEAPVVGTRAAMEGLEAVDGENCLLAESPAEFVAGVKAVLEDQAAADRLGAQGRRMVQSRYSWKTIGAHLRELYQRLESDRPRSRG